MKPSAGIPAEWRRQVRKKCFIAIDEWTHNGERERGTDGYMSGRVATIDQEMEVMRSEQS